MSWRGDITVECDSEDCHAEIVYGALDLDNIDLNERLTDDGWRHTLQDRVWIDTCPQCQEDAEPEERDDAYERAAAKARNNDFAETGGKDWT